MTAENTVRLPLLTKAWKELQAREQERLEDRIYSDAMDFVFILNYFERWPKVTPAMLSRMRRDLHRGMSDWFPNIDAGTLIRVSDSMLMDLDFPFSQLD